jgi:hypothetical protein
MAAMDLQLHDPKLGGGWSAPSSVSGLCESAGITRSQLYAQAVSRGVRLGSVLDAWRAAQLVAVRDMAGLSWADLEYAGGFLSRSGLSDLIRRGLGEKYGALKEASSEDVLLWFETHSLGSILSPAGHDHGASPGGG